MLFFPKKIFWSILIILRMENVDLYFHIEKHIPYVFFLAIVLIQVLQLIFNVKYLLLLSFVFKTCNKRMLFIYRLVILFNIYTGSLRLHCGGNMFCTCWGFIRLIFQPVWFILRLFERVRILLRFFRYRLRIINRWMEKRVIAGFLDFKADVNS